MNTTDSFPSIASHRLTYGANVSQTATTPTPQASAPTNQAGDSPAPAPVDDGGRRADTTDIALERLGVLPWLPEMPETRVAASHDPRSAYVETFWLPILGPSTTLLLRRLASEFEQHPDGFEMDCLATSRELGLGVKLTRRSPFARTIERCITFNLAKRCGDVLYVRQRLLPLSRRQISRLSNRLQELHSAWTIDPHTDGELRRTELVRATHLARTLLSLGESTSDAEQQLHRWHFHPSISWHAVQWAQTDHADDVPI